MINELGLNLARQPQRTAPHGRDPAETSTSLMWFILQIEGFPHCTSKGKRYSEEHWCQGDVA